MSDLESTDWSEIAANNIQPAPAGWPPNSSPNIVYTTDREMMGAIKRDWNRRNATVTSAGTPNAQTLTYTQGPTAYVVGQRFSFIVGGTNTGAVTLNVSGLGAKAVQLNGAALVGGEMKVGRIVECIYDGTQFQIIGGSSPFLGAVGGVVSNTLQIGGANPVLQLNKAASGGSNLIQGTIGASVARWTLELGDTTTETGSGNTGSNFVVDRYADGGALLDQPLSIIRSTGQVAIKGTGTNDNAAAGFVGEVISQAPAGPTLGSGTVANIASITVTGGDWDVQGEVWHNIGTGGATALYAGINTVSTTLPAAAAVNTSRAQFFASFTASQAQILSLRPCQISVAGSTTVYLVGAVIFPSGTVTSSGVIWARRRR